MPIFDDVAKVRLKTIDKLFVMPYTLHMNETQLLTTKQAAHLLGMSIRRVQQLASSGRLTGEKSGRDWLFEMDAIMAFARKPRKTGRPAKSKEEG